MHDLFPAVPLFGHQVGFLEHGDVLLNGREAHLVAAGEGRNGLLTLDRVHQDVASGGVGKGMEDPIHVDVAVHTCNHMVVRYPDHPRNAIGGPDG